MELCDEIEIPIQERFTPSISIKEAIRHARLISNGMTEIKLI